MKTKSTPDQFGQIIEGFKAMQTVQQEQAINLNTLTVHFEHIKGDIQAIKDSLLRQDGLIATKEELTNLDKKTTESLIELEARLNVTITNTAQSIRGEQLLPNRMAWGAISATGAIILAAIYKLIIK